MNFMFPFRNKNIHWRTAFVFVWPLQTLLAAGYKMIVLHHIFAPQRKRQYRSNNQGCGVMAKTVMTPVSGP